MTVALFLQWRECNAEKHYMRGGKIGEFPAFDDKYIPGGTFVSVLNFAWSSLLNCVSHLDPTLFLK